MKYIKLILSLLLVAFLATSSIAQDNKANTKNHSHPEIEKKLEEIKEITEKANKTFNMAQETYKSMDSREGRFFTMLQILIALLGVLGIGSYFINNHISRKAKDEAIKKAEDEVKEIKNEVLKIQSKNIKKIIEANERTVIEMIASKERDYFLRENSKIIVINHEDTPISKGFEKVLELFKQVNLKRDTTHSKNLAETLTTENIEKFKKSDLVIIENQATAGQWEIGKMVLPKDELIRKIDECDKDTKDKLKDHLQNQALMIKLANEICKDTALIYYGPGLFSSEMVDEDKQHLIAFANSPSTLYSNVMNLLKFKDILESEQEKA